MDARGILKKISSLFRQSQYEGRFTQVIQQKEHELQRRGVEQIAARAGRTTEAQRKANEGLAEIVENREQELDAKGRLPAENR